MGADGLRVAIATAAEAQGLDDDEPLLVEAFARHGVAAEPAVWDADVAWSRYDAVVVRSTWDYPARRAEFLAWAADVDGRLWNGPRVLAWNTDKVYLRELAAAGVPVVPTTWIEPDATGVTLPADGDYVVKPSVSAGSKDTVRYRAGEDVDAVEHVRLIQKSGRVTMVQPYVASVDSYGETALLYVEGSFSHAIRKGPLLTAGQGFVDGLFAAEEITARRPSPAEREVADRVVTAARQIVGDLLYARVDLVAGDDGQPLLLELELAEPSMFFGYDDGAADRLAAAVLARLG
ncbi:MAG: hypothetical protein GEV07_07705 [Streptosporangiales bacterium]|nr:hypothetical protein [Streptosporangiales bacterium]